MIRIVPLLPWIGCLVLLLPLSSTATAEEVPVVEESVETVNLVVTYARAETPEEDVAGNIVVVTREEIERTPASNAAEVLQYVPGVYVELNGGRGSTATASIQGSDPRHVAVYQDGVPLNMLANPMTDLSYIPLSVIDRIEVYKGAASSVWGSALGGVINIITREPDPTRQFAGEVLGSLGYSGTYRAGGMVNGTVDRLGYLLSMSRDAGDGFAPHTEFRHDDAYAKLNYLVGEASRLNFVCAYDEGRHESPSALFLGQPFWEDFLQQRSYQRLLYEMPFLENLGWTIEARHQEFDLTDTYTPPGDYPKGWDYTEELWGISARVHHDIKDRNRLLAGFDGDWGKYDWSFYSREFHTGNWAIYANDTVEMDPFSFIAGLRYDNNQDFGSEISPLGGIVYRLPFLSSLIRAQVARGFSAPPPALLNDPMRGNKDLKAETGTNYQLGGEISPLKPLRIEVNLFHAHIQDLINYDPEIEKYKNIDEVVRKGVEGRINASFEIRPESRLWLSFGASFVDVRDDETSEVIENIPRIIYDASASHTYKSITQSIVGRYVYNNSSFEETRDQVFVFDYLVKARLPILFDRLAPTLFLAVHDLFDADYVYRDAFPQPGRWLEGGVKLEF